MTDSAPTGEERPVGRGELGFVDLALQDGELVAQRHDSMSLSALLIGSSRRNLIMLVSEVRQSQEHG
jgi:hypothetical protein